MSEENKSEVEPTSKSIVLSEIAIRKIDRWLEQIDGKRVRLSRKEFLNWFIEKSPENLSNADLNSLVEKYYDEEKFLRQLLREMKQAKKDGQTSHLEVVVRAKKNELRREVANSPEDETSEETDANVASN